MAPHQPSANAISAPTIYTLLVTSTDHIYFPIHFGKSIIMTRHVDYEPKGWAAVTRAEMHYSCECSIFGTVPETVVDHG